MRHGERLDHERRAVWNKELAAGTYRSYDPPLTDNGVKECFEIATRRLRGKVRCNCPALNLHVLHCSYPLPYWPNRVSPWLPVPHFSVVCKQLRRLVEL